jgi:hypothetical protein
VEPKTSYVPVRWIHISGGIGVYDSKLASPEFAEILIADSVINILQDPRRSITVPPFSNDCRQKGDSCKSFLLPGGLDLVSPWPYAKLNDSSLDTYVMKNAPSYQIDFWDPPENVTIAKEACSVYAATETAGFQLCLSSFGDNPDQIVAGKYFNSSVRLKIDL